MPITDELMIEATTPRKWVIWSLIPRRRKKIYTYDESLRRADESAYDRHLRIQEVFGLIIDGLEGRLQGENLTAFEDMISPGSEFTDEIFDAVGRNTLHVYQTPKKVASSIGEYGIINYDFRNMVSSERLSFDITGISNMLGGNMSIPLTQLYNSCHELYAYMIPLNPDQFPEKIRNSTRVTISLMPTPMGIVVDKGTYHIKPLSKAGSRGVVGNIQHRLVI